MINVRLYMVVCVYAWCIVSACNTANQPHEPVVVDAAKDSTETYTASLQKIDTITGDFDGDGTQEQMWLIPPDSLTDDADCIGGCTSYIHFSKPNIPSIKIESSIGGTPVNHGDLNNNGTDEIGLLPDWFSSCWRHYYVWTLLDGKWELAVPPIHTHCNQWEEEVIPIEIDSSKEGYVITRHSDMDEAGFVIKTESIAIKR